MDDIIYQFTNLSYASADISPDWSHDLSHDVSHDILCCLFIYHSVLAHCLFQSQEWYHSTYLYISSLQAL